MKTLKVVLQEVISGVKAWANDNFSLGTHVHGNITNDGKVGTTANLPLITGTSGTITTGSFGTSANTFCEGNDSRLSDARTPVAHTHGKADVTDLLNSDFIPSANNSYNLGSSSYQWNNLYAKNYYYNGVAWGLDKNNHWKISQILHADTTIDIVNNLSNEIVGPALYWQDNNRFWAQYVPVWGTDGSFRLELGISNYHSNGGQGYWTIVNKISKDFGTFDFYTTHGAANLGTSTNKWKTLNGINPGALSLPGTGGYTDIKGDITNLSGGDNTFTAPYDGWVCVKSTNATVIHIINTNWAVCQSATQSTAGTLCCLCPVMSGESFKVIVNATSLDYAYIHPCKGNV